jgi:hypothetical protein
MSLSDSISWPISFLTMPNFSTWRTVNRTPTTRSVSTSPKSTSKFQMGLSELLTTLDLKGLVAIPCWWPPAGSDDVLLRWLRGCGPLRSLPMSQPALRWNA